MDHAASASSIWPRVGPGEGLLLVFSAWAHVLLAKRRSAPVLLTRRSVMSDGIQPFRIEIPQADLDDPHHLGAFFGPLP
jgi:hypothetical protein